MRLILLYWLCGLAVAEQHLSSLTPRFDSNLSMLDKTNRSSLELGTEKEINTNNEENQQRSYENKPAQTIVLEEKHTETGHKKEKREMFQEDEEKTNIESNENSYLQTYVPIHPLGPKRLPLFPKKPKRILFPHKSLFPKLHSKILGSSQHFEQEEIPESILLQILSSNPRGNKDGFKYGGLTKTTAYNLTKQLNSKEENNFILEKKENLTIEMSYLDSQNRETKYSNTNSSLLHKVLGPQILDDVWTSEEDVEGNPHGENIDENIILPNNNADLPQDFVGSVKSSKGKSAVSKYSEKAPTDFVGGTYVSSGFENPTNAPSISKETQFIAHDKNENDDLLGQPNIVDGIYPTALMPEMTITDFKNLIEKSILEKRYTESSKATTVQDLEDNTNLPDNNGKNMPDKAFTNQKEDDHDTEKTPALTNPETIAESNLNGESTESTSLSKQWSTDNASLSLIPEDKTSPTNDTLLLTIKHGESIVLDPNLDNLPFTTLLSKQNTAISDSYTNDKIKEETEQKKTTEENETEETTLKSDVVKLEQTSTAFYPTTSEGKLNSLNQLQTTDSLKRNKGSDESKNDGGFNKYEESILEKDPQTEEVSTEISVTKDEMYPNNNNDVKTNKIIKLKDKLSMIDVNETDTEKEKTLEEESTEINPEEGDETRNLDDTEKSSVKPIKVTLSNHISQETLEEVNETDIEKDNILQKESTEINPEEVDESRNSDDTEIISVKPLKVTLSNQINQDTSEEVNASDSDKDKTLRKDKPFIYNENIDETSEYGDVTGEYSNLKPSKIKLGENLLGAPVQRGDIYIQGITTYNEDESEDTTPTHEVELFSGQSEGKGQKIGNNDFKNSQKPSLNKTGWEKPIKEPLTELCFPVMNKKEVSLWDLLSGKLYLESEGKRVQLKLKHNPMKRCNSGTEICKLPVTFENTNEPVKGTDSWEENDDNYTAKIRKKRTTEGKSYENKKNELQEMDHLSMEQDFKNRDTNKKFGSGETSNSKQFFLTDLMLMLLTNETSTNSGVRKCTRTSKSTEEVVNPRLQSNPDSAQPDSTLTSFPKKSDDDENVKNPHSSTPNVSKSTQSGKRFKRTLVHKQDTDHEKEGGCGCGSVLGRTLPPIPNHDHFLGKRLNIITSIAHAIKDWAISTPTY